MGYFCSQGNKQDSELMAGEQSHAGHGPRQQLAGLSQAGILGHLTQLTAWRAVGETPAQAYLQKLDHIHRPLGSQVWRGILFRGGLGFRMRQSQSWRGAGA